MECRLICEILPDTGNSGDVSWCMHVAQVVDYTVYIDVYDTTWNLKLCRCEGCMIWMANDGVYYSYCWWRYNLWLCSILLLEHLVNLTAHTDAQGDSEVCVLCYYLKFYWCLRTNLPHQILLMTLIYSTCAHNQPCNVYDRYYQQKW